MATTITKGTGDTAGFNVLVTNPVKILEYLYMCEKLGITYGLGSKPMPIGVYPPKFINQKMQASKTVDCSGFVRGAIFHATGYLLPDGSVNQHDWCDKIGLKKTDYANCSLNDGHIRICFLSPQDEGGIGHVWLCYRGKIIQSSGGRGPNGDRPSSAYAKCHYAYVLC